MTYEQEFLKDFEEWVVTQVKVNETALAASKKIWEEDGDERARDASLPTMCQNRHIRWELRQSCRQRRY